MNTQIKNISIKTLLIGILALMVLFIGPQAQAQDPRFKSDIRFSKISIIPERGAIKSGDEITLATQIDLAPHWHTYWRNPGDSGLPINITWDLPEGFEVSEINWPTPDKIPYDILVNYGFYNQLTLLQTLKIPDQLPQGKIDLKATYEILVCKDICIPEYDEVSISLNDPANLNINNSKIIEAKRSKLPKPIKGQFSFRDEKDYLRLSLIPDNPTILSNATKDNAEFFPHDWGITEYAATPEVIIEDGKIIIAQKRGAEPIDPEKMLEGLLVIKRETGQNKGFIINAAAAGTPQTPTQENSEKESLTLLGAIILAFLGGLVLNLMPCVFPVLSIKALSLVEMKGQKAKEAQLHGLAYTAGVIISFLIIAGVLIALKHAGAAVGWGFQLQNPLVVGLLAYLLFLIGLSLAGLFEIGGSLTSIGGKLTQSHSYNGSFFTGVLATVVATPCTAPFMGAAMGFALTQPAFISLIVFTVLGLGLAMPYLLLSYIPAARVLLPRPGPWMETFKQFLAFPMFASAIWLIWVISQQAGTTGIFIALFGLLFITFAVWLAKLIKKKPTGKGAILAKALLIISIIGVGYTLNEIRTFSSPETMQPVSENHTATPYSKAALDELLQSDDPVFVEMTAAWCITCKVNETTVLNTRTIKDLFKEKNVQLIIGDWTNHSSAITAYLDENKRNGVPLYVYYGKPDPVTKIRPKPAILPQILTTGIVRDALR